MSDRANLGKFLRDVIHWRWDEFVRAEKDPSYSPLQGTVFSLIRACADGKLGAIKLSIKRVDGNLETPVNVVYPRIFFRYPYAKEVAAPATIAGLQSGVPGIDVPLPDEFDEPEMTIEDEKLTLGLRETLNKMADTPDSRIVPLVLHKKQQVEDKLKENPDYTDALAPQVKSVISANLLNLAIAENNFEAITEVFDQIDGKLVETIRFLGDDMFMDQYTEIAPAGAILNEDGIYMLEMKDISNTWEKKFQSSKKL